ncbi:hypothetical protein LJC61_06080 [Ruminococcaceae bacterium OttesenSCG-928-A16]|nr:hypothetical protein [Ruminococcaceae bacterium OttesenSCG-928-A16]
MARLTALLAVFLVVGLTFALMVVSMQAVTNPFRMGTGGVDIPEIVTSTPEGKIEWGANTKQVSLSNTGNVPSVVRAMIVPQFKIADTSNFTQGNLGQLTSPLGNTLEVGDFVLHFAESFDETGQSDNWFYKDGYFYYKTVLQPSGTTATNLLMGVTLKEGINPADYEGVEVYVDVLADCLQAVGAAPAEWGITVQDTAVLP